MVTISKAPNGRTANTLSDCSGSKREGKIEKILIYNCHLLLITYYKFNDSFNTLNTLVYAF